MGLWELSFITDLVEPFDSSMLHVCLRFKIITKNYNKNRMHWHNKLEELCEVMYVKSQNKGITNEKGIWRHVSFAFYYILVAYGLVYNIN